MKFVLTLKELEDIVEFWKKGGLTETDLLGLELSPCPVNSKLTELSIDEVDSKGKLVNSGVVLIK